MKSVCSDQRQAHPVRPMRTQRDSLFDIRGARRTGNEMRRAADDPVGNPCTGRICMINSHAMPNAIDLDQIATGIHKL